jgi:hypothetical protein
MFYSKTTRPMTDTERETAQHSQARFAPALPSEREAFYRKLRRNVWIQTIGVALFASGILLALTLQNSNNKLRDGILIGILLVLGFGIPIYRSLSKFACAEREQFDEEQEGNKFHYQRWEEIIQKGVMWVKRIETTRFAEVLPDHSSMATYYFADLGKDGIYCLADKATTPNDALECVTFAEYENGVFTPIGMPLSPIQTLSWSDFTEPHIPGHLYGGHYDFRPPFPENGMRYALPFNDIKDILVFLSS